MKMYNLTVWEDYAEIVHEYYTNNIDYALDEARRFMLNTEKKNLVWEITESNMV